MAKENPAAVSRGNAAGSHGMKDPDRLWALDIEPDLDALDDDMKKYFDICREKLGLLPNVLRAYGFNPAKLKAFVDSYNQLMLADGALSKLEREMIAVAVSSVNKCVYCLVAHGSAVRQYSGDPILGEMIAHNYRMADLTPRHRAMLDFTVKLTETPARMGEADRGALREAGFDDAAIFDIAEVTGFFNMTNRIASAIELLPNPAYHSVAR